MRISTRGKQKRKNSLVLIESNIKNNESIRILDACTAFKINCAEDGSVKVGSVCSE